MGALLLTLAACSDDDADSTEPTATEQTEAEPTAAEPTAAEPTEAAPPTGEGLIAVADSGLGQIVTDPAGWTLYMFVPDEAGVPTCVADCAGNWPPLLVEDGVELLAGEGIDPALLSTVAHPEGGTQLKLGNWPLYYFANDGAAGDTNGQGVGDVWFVIGADGEPIR